MRRQRHLPLPEPTFAIRRSAALICHDLRLPLAVILANAEFLAQSRLTDIERNSLLVEIRSAINQMNEMVSSFLEFPKDTSTLRPAARNIIETLERAIRMANVRREFSRINFKYSHEGSAIGWFDSSSLERAVANLILNACEAVAPDVGQIIITSTANEHCLQIAVSDNGPGISEALQDAIFQPFVSYGKPNGNGLGLAIANQIVRDHGGEICLDREQRAGTTFVITMPFAIPEGAIAPRSLCPIDSRRQRAVERAVHHSSMNLCHAAQFGCLAVQNSSRLLAGCRSSLPPFIVGMHATARIPVNHPDTTQKAADPRGRFSNLRY